MVQPNEALKPGDAVLAVDVQNDFCPGGALPIEGGHAVVPVLNAWAAAARALNLPVYASRDWHPANHLSFEAQGGQWPPHCIQDTGGAAFHPNLRLPDGVMIVTKGTRFDKDQYSTFDETGLASELKKRGVKRLWVGGLAEDVCVRASVLDARDAGLDVHLIAAATRPVTAQGGEAARAEMASAGAVIEE